MPILRLLLEHDAQVNIYGGVFGDALRASSVRGHHACLEVLLEHDASIENLIGLLLASSQEAPEAESANAVLAEQLQSAYEKREPISHFAALVKRAHFYVRSRERNARRMQGHTGGHPNLLRLQKLVRQAVQSDSDRQPLNPWSRLYNAALDIRNAPIADSGDEEKRYNIS